MKKKVSIITACFNEKSNVEDLFQELEKVTNKLKKYDFEYIFVDNGSCDNTWDFVKKIVSRSKKVLGVRLSRNFGPESSLLAGIMHAKSDAVVAIECDLQSPPDIISKFIKKWEEGNEVVIGRYEKAQDGLFISFMRRTYYRLFKYLSKINIPINAAGFCLLDKKAVIALQSLPEKYRLFIGLRAWIGFKTAYVSYKRKKRKKGKSTYRFLDYIKHAERGIFGFSYLPLDIMTYLGLILVSLSFLFIIGMIMLFFIYGNPVKGSMTILLAIVFFGGVQILSVSIIGKYIQIITEETKGRPPYIVTETLKK